jgi:hypothetical protein
MHGVGNSQKPFESTPESIWEDIDMLEGDPTHRGIGPCATPDKTILLTTEASEWERLWETGSCFDDP